MNPLDEPVDKAGMQADEKVAGNIRTRDRLDLRKVMETEEGRRFVWRIMAASGVLQNAHHGGEIRDYLLGRQSVGQDVMIWLEGLEPGAFFELGAEAARWAASDKSDLVNERRELKREQART